MKILKRGTTYLFVCDACGCGFVANKLEVTKENDPTIDAKKFVRVGTNCPDCGKHCAATFPIWEERGETVEKSDCDSGV